MVLEFDIDKWARTLLFVLLVTLVTEWRFGGRCDVILVPYISCYNSAEMLSPANSRYPFLVPPCRMHEKHWYKSQL